MLFFPHLRGEGGIWADGPNWVVWCWILLCVCVFCQTDSNRDFHMICKGSFARFSSRAAKMKATEWTHLGGDDSRAGMCHEKRETKPWCWPGSHLLLTCSTGMLRRLAMSSTVSLVAEMMPTLLAMALAVMGWSPVTIMTWARHKGVINGRNMEWEKGRCPLQFGIRAHSKGRWGAAIARLCINIWALPLL